MITTGLFIDERNWLMCEVAKDQRTLFMFRLLELHGDESCLDRNRFSRFRHARQSFDVCVPITDNPSLSTQIIWINEHCQSLWSLRTSVVDIHHIFAEFSFADAWEAAYFTLAYGGALDDCSKTCN
jgi:hypothetical protein